MVAPTGRAVGSGSFQLDRRLALVSACLAKPRESGKGIEQAAGTGGHRRIDPAREHLPDDTEFGSTERGNWSEFAHLEGPLAVSLVEETKGGTARLADCPIATGEPERPKFGKAAPAASCDQ